MFKVQEHGFPLLVGSVHIVFLIDLYGLYILIYVNWKNSAKLIQLIGSTM